MDAGGNLFIADTDNDCIREVNACTGVITTVAGNGTWGYSGDGGPATAAELGYPDGIAVDASGDLFIADTENNVHPRSVWPRAGSHAHITTVAGTPTSMAMAAITDWPPRRSSAYPKGVAVDSSGDLFIADSGNNRVREVTAPRQPAGTITTAAGTLKLGL